MKDSKLVSVLFTFNKEDWASFQRYLGSYTAETSDLFKVLAFLKSSKDKFTSLPEVDVVIEKSFPHLTVKVLQNHMSVLLQHLEKWLSIQEMQRTKFDEDLYLLNAYNRRSLYKLADQTQARLEKKIEEHTAFDFETEKCKSQMLYLQYFSNNPVKNRVGISMLQQMVQSFLYSYKEYCLFYLIELQNWGEINKYDYSETIRTVEQSLVGIPDSPLAVELDLLWKVHKNSDVSALNTITENLLAHKYLPGVFAHIILTEYAILRNNILSNMGYDINRFNMAALYEYALDTGVLMENGKVSLIRITNVVAAVAWYKPYEWVEAFILRWIDNVLTTNKEGSKNLLLALNCLYHEKYDQMLVFTNGANYGSPDQKLRAMGLHIIALFMHRKEDYETFKHQLRNMQLLLKRNKASLAIKQFHANYNLLDFLKRLDQDDRKTSQLDLSKYPYLMYRTWCEKQLAKTKGDHQQR
ncbi:MAG: hypothetical protein IPN29_20325 [Saprospiraceae bacterium]|nr:hypothetical protein [Saprospiraceae bacterium]